MSTFNVRWPMWQSDSDVEGNVTDCLLRDIWTTRRSTCSQKLSNCGRLVKIRHILLEGRPPSTPNLHTTLSGREISMMGKRRSQEEVHASIWSDVRWPIWGGYGNKEIEPGEMKMKIIPTADFFYSTYRLRFTFPLKYWSTVWYNLPQRRIRVFVCGCTHCIHVLSLCVCVCENPCQICFQLKNNKRGWKERAWEKDTHMADARHT